MNKRYSLSQIINEALFSKDNGYYRYKNPLGKDGDFITSPEISQIFGEIIAGYFLHIFFANKAKLSFVEVGAGRGFLMRDILKSINNLANKKNAIALDFLSHATFHIIEINTSLIAIQKQNLQEFYPSINIKWHENFANFLSEKNGQIFLLSNELFDCFAIDQFVKTNKGWCKRLIEFADDSSRSNPQIIIDEFNFETDQFVKQELGVELSCKANIGAVFEYSLSARNFMREICQAIKDHGAIAINCDYGYDNYEFANSLQALKNHQRLDFIDALSGCDITAHVDFLALDKIAKNFKLKTSLVSQRQFLLELGANERSQKLIEKNPQQAQQIAEDLERLISPTQMGELFKFHIIWR
jgi:SAM-dependent MidA family methyltransferase